MSSYGKVAAPVTSAAGLAPTPAEGEPGAVAGPEAPERQGRPWRSHSPPGAADQHRARPAAAGHPVRPDWSGGTDHHADHHPAGAVHRDQGRSAATGHQPAADLNRSDWPCRRGHTPHKRTTLVLPAQRPNSGDRVLTNCGTRGTGSSLTEQQPTVVYQCWILDQQPARRWRPEPPRPSDVQNLRMRRSATARNPSPLRYDGPPSEPMVGPLAVLREEMNRSLPAGSEPM